jgi:hypothetical protein
MDVGFRPTAPSNVLTKYSGGYQDERLAEDGDRDRSFAGNRGRACENVR